MVAEALSRFGVAGNVEVLADRVVLRGNGPEASYQLGMLPAQWDTLPMDVRQRKATEIVRSLVAERRASLPAPAGGSARGGGASIIGWVAPVVAIGLAGGLVYGIYRALGPAQGGGEKVERTPAAGSVAMDDRRARALRVCEATRSRVMRGATVGPTDVEGWVVEIVLLREGSSSDLTYDPALTAFVNRGPGETSGKLVWPVAKDVVAADGPFTTVEVADASIPDARAPQWRGVQLTFRGRYVVPYFREEHRIQYVRLANTLADRLGAGYGALYARCDDGQSHHMGAWFLGSDPGSAVASLIYFLGTYADVSHVRRSVLKEDAGDGIDRAYAFRRIAVSTKALRRERVLGVLGPHGGGRHRQGRGAHDHHVPVSRRQPGSSREPDHRARSRDRRGPLRLRRRSAAGELLPGVGRVGLERQSVDGTVHGVAEGPIHELVLLNRGLAFEHRRDDAGLVVVLGAGQIAQLDVGVGHCGEQQRLDLVGLHHGC